MILSPEIDAFSERIRTEEVLRDSRQRLKALNGSASQLAALLSEDVKWRPLLVRTLRLLAIDTPNPVVRDDLWQRINNLLDASLRPVATPAALIVYGEYAVDFAQQSASSKLGEAQARFSVVKKEVDRLVRSANTACSDEVRSELLALKAKVLRQSRRIVVNQLAGSLRQNPKAEAKEALKCAIAAYGASPLPNTTLELALCHETCSIKAGDKHDQESERFLTEAIAKDCVNAAYHRLARLRLQQRMDEALAIYRDHVLRDADVRRRYRVMPVVGECVRALHYKHAKQPALTSPWLDPAHLASFEDELESSIRFGPATARAIILLAELRAFRQVPWAVMDEMFTLEPNSPGYWNSIVEIIERSFGNEPEIASIAAEARDSEVINQLGTYTINFRPEKIDFSINCYRQAYALAREARYKLNLARSLIKRGKSQDLLDAGEALNHLQPKSHDWQWSEILRELTTELECKKSLAISATSPKSVKTHF